MALYVTCVSLLSRVAATSHTPALQILIKMEGNTKSSSQLHSLQLEGPPAFMWLLVIVLDSANIHISIIPESSESTACFDYMLRRIWDLKSLHLLP